MASYWIDTLVLKNRGKYLCYSAASSLPLRANPTQAQEVARRISGVVAGESTQKVNIPSTHHNPYLSHYIICHLPLVFLSPTSPLPFYSLSFPLASFSFAFCLPFACLCVGLFVRMAQDNTKLCDFSNTNNNDFISTPIAPITDAKSCEINAALLNLVMKDQFSGLPSEDVATHLNNFVDLCDMQKKRDTDNYIVKFKLFPFSLRDHAKTWFSSLARNSIDGISAKMLLSLSIFPLLRSSLLETIL